MRDGEDGTHGVLVHWCGNSQLEMGDLGTGWFDVFITKL